jgi:hypothetical protein
MTDGRKAMHTLETESRSLLRSLAENFPGLVDVETDVNGADLVDYLTYQIDKCEQVKQDMRCAILFTPNFGEKS